MAIRLQNFDLVQQLTTSPHNLRYLGFLKRDITRQPYIIEIIDMPYVYDIKRLKLETEQLMQLQHHFLLKKIWMFIQARDGIDYLVVILHTYSEWLTLKQLMSSDKLSQEGLFQIMLKLIDLLEYLHSQGMYLRSISLSQIHIVGRKPLLNYLYLPQLSNKLLLMEIQNSLEEIWIAPQTLEKDRVNEQSDIWCLGALLYQILTGKSAISGKQLKIPRQSSKNNINDIRQQNLHFLVDIMVKADPLDRASLMKIKNMLVEMISNSSFDFLKFVHEQEKLQQPSIFPLKNIKAGCFIGKYEVLKILRSQNKKISCLTFDKQFEEERMLKMMEVPEDWLQITLQELNKYSEIKHQNLVRIRSVTSFEVKDDSDTRIVALISDYYPEGTVEDALEGMAWMTLNEAKDVCLQVNSALSYLHRQGIIHQNLKNGNIYRKKQRWILGEKLTFFELQKRVQKYAKTSKVPIDCPPECIQSQSPDQFSDVWCVAALFLTIHLNQLIKEQQFLSYNIKSSDYIDKYLGKRMGQLCEEWLKQATKQHSNQRIGLAQISEKLANINPKINTQQQILREKYQVYQKKEKASQTSFYDSDEQNTGGIVTDEARNQDQNDSLTDIKGKVQYPYDAIGRIFSKFSDRNISGNGFLLTKDLVLTCAHNVHNKKIGQDAKQIFFIHPSGKIKVLEYYYPKDFQRRSTDTKEKDYCIILLEKTVQIDKFLNIAIDYDDLSEKTEIAGYINRKEEKDYVLCCAKDKIKKMKKGFIQHYVPTIHGFSGSPMLIQAFDGFYYVVGIHIASKNSDSAEQLKCGIHLTMENMKNLLTWVRATPKRTELFTFISYESIKLRQPQRPRDDYVPPSEKIKSLQKMLSQEKQKDKQSWEVADLNNLIGHQLNKSKNYGDALFYYERALSYSVKNKHNENVAVGYNNIGLCYHDLKEYEVALEYYFKALTIDKQIWGESHPSVASTYLNIGNTKYNLGDYSQALRYYQQAIPIFKQHKQKQLLAAALNNMARIQYKNKEYDRASQNSREALDINQELFGKVSPQSLCTLSVLSFCYFRMGRRMESLEGFYTCILNMETLKMSKHHPQYQALLSTLPQFILYLILKAAVEKPKKEQFLLAEKILVKLSLDDALLMRLREFLRNMK